MEIHVLELFYILLNDQKINNFFIKIKSISFHFMFSYIIYEMNFYIFYFNRNILLIKVSSHKFLKSLVVISGKQNNKRI